MEYEVRITLQAQAHLREIRDYIAQKLLAPEAAKSTVQRLGTVMASLSQMPKRVPLVEEEPWRSEGVRVRAVRNFLIYFWVNEAEKTAWIDAENKIVSFHAIDNGEMIMKTENLFWEFLFGLTSSGYRVM